MKTNALTPTVRALMTSGAPLRVKEDAGELSVLVKAMEEHHKATNDRIGSTDQKMAELIARLSEVEQKAVRRGDTSLDREPSWGEAMAKDDAFLALAKSSTKRGRATVQVKALTTGTGSGGAFVPHDLKGPQLLPRRRIRMRDIIAPGRTNSTSVEYPRQTTRTNAAATVAEGDSKPESTYAFELVTAPVRTIAHWTLASKQLLDDVPLMTSIIDNELRYGLQDVEDAQLLNGGGTGTDLSGIYTQATAYSAPFVPQAAGNLTKIDVLLLAMAQVGESKFQADAIVMNPLDAADIQMIKTDDGAYLGSGPFSAEQVARLWRLPVVETHAMTVGSFLVGAFQTCSQIFDREDANVEISSEDSDNFRKNLLTLRGEERLALAVYRTLGFVKGTFSDALSA